MSIPARIKQTKRPVSLEIPEDTSNIYKHIGTFRKKSPTSPHRSKTLQASFEDESSQPVEPENPNNLSTIEEHPVQPKAKKSVTINTESSVEPSPLNIGIYLDDTDLAIATSTSTNIRGLQVLCALPATISFFENRINIGTTEDGALRLHELLQTPDGAIIKVGADEEDSLLPEEILTIFFHKLFTKLASSKETKGIGSIVFTITFPMTSLGKERLKQSLANQGYLDVRILSSVLSTAIWSALYENHREDKDRQQNFYVLVHTLMSSFTMAIVRVSKSSITTKRYVLSQNLSICQDRVFMENHSRLFSDQAAGEDTRNLEKLVFEAYKVGLNTLMTEFGSKQIHKVIGIARSHNDAKLARILRCFYSNRILTLVNSNGPLVGACLLASRHSQSPAMLSWNTEILDACQSDLVILSDTHKLRIPYRNQKLSDAQVSCFVIPAPPEGTRITLLEETRRTNIVIGQYALQAGDDQPRVFKPKNVRLTLNVNYDGVFYIKAHLDNDTESWNLVRINKLQNDEFSPESLMILKSKFNYTDAPTQINKSGKTDKLEYFSNASVSQYRLGMRPYKKKSSTVVQSGHEMVKEEVEERFRDNCERHGLNWEEGLHHLRELLESVFENIVLANQQGKALRWYDDYVKVSKTKACG